MAGIGTLTKQAVLQLRRHANKMKTQEGYDRFASTPVSIFSNPNFYRTYRADVTKSPSLKAEGTRDDLLNMVYDAPVAKKKGSTEPKTAMARAHYQAKNLRAGSKNPINPDREVQEYLDKGTERPIGMVKDKEGVYIHPDLQTPTDLVNKVDFQVKGKRVKLGGEETPFDTQTQGVLTNQIRNATYHQHLENRLVRWLTEKKIIQQAYREGKISKGKFVHDTANSNSHIRNIKRDMSKLGLESMVYDKATKRFNYFGRKYGDDVDKQFEGMLADIPRTYLLRNPPYSVSKGFDKSKKEYWQKPIGHAKGGLIKKGIKKAIDMAVDNTRFDPSRRKFLKQAGATAAATAMPRAALKGASALAQASIKEVTRKSPPWIKAMVSALELGKKAGQKLIKSDVTDNKTTKQFEITTADGGKDLVIYRKYKSGDVHIEFDIRDDFANNQHIYIDRKTGTTEIVDENYYMTSPEDYAKDDPIIFDVTTPTQMEERARRLGVMKGDVDDRMLDYASTPEDGDYSYLFERYIDTYSPSGNIFNTKKQAQQLRQKRAYENMTEEEFESQFRGGTLHGFRRGGDVKPRFKPPTDRIVPRPKPDRYQVMPKNVDFNRLMNSIRFVESRGDDFAYSPDTQATGAFQILPSTARKPGYGVTPFRNFDTDPYNIVEQRRFAGDYMQALLDYYDGDYQKALSQYGGDSTPGYFNKVMDAYYRYEKGGLAKNATHDEMVAYIRKNPQEYAVGGIVKKLAPKVIGKLREFAPKIEGPKTPKQSFTAFDEAGLPIKDFDNFKDAQKFVEKEPAYSVGNTPKPQTDDTAGAMFWPSREKLIDAPFETAKGSEWLAYLKRPFAKHNPVKDMELNDTQLSTHLSRNANNKLSKADVVKDFDEKLAPDIDVIVLGGGRRDTSRALQDILRTDLQGFRPGPLRNTLSDLQLRVNPLAEAIGNNDKQGILKIVGQIEDSVQKNFGVPNSITEGFPQKFPFELKEPLQEIAQLSGVRLAGFKSYAREANYRGQQTLSGGSNYREFLFKYNHKPGSLRNTEPTYTYAHDFGLTTSQRAGGFVHMRTSDRTDAFGRRILHIEEIQSDMHQPINAAARRVKKYQAEQAARGEPLSNTRAYQNDIEAGTYAPRGDVVREVDNANEQQMMLIQAKIDDLLQLPQTQQTQVRIARLNRERAKIRKIIADKRAKAGEGNHSGVPQGPYSKTEDYNEFVMKYALRTAQEGGYDGISISSPQIKNLSTSRGSRDYMGNITAYGPIAEGAMKKVGKKSGAKFMKTVITDDSKRAFEVPTLIIKDNPAAQDIISKGLGAYKRGGIVVNG